MVDSCNQTDLKLPKAQRPLKHDLDIISRSFQTRDRFGNVYIGE